MGRKTVTLWYPLSKAAQEIIQYTMSSMIELHPQKSNPRSAKALLERIDHGLDR